LEKKFRHYDAEFKLSVLRRIREDGLSHRQAAAVFNIRNMSCLSDWERRYERGGIEALVSRRTGRPGSMPKPPTPSQPRTSPSDDTRSREELLAELGYLRMENAYLKKLKALTQAQLPLPLKKRKPFRRPAPLFAF
jgi:transposase